MKILLIHQAFVTPKQGGGTRHYELARYCLAKGADFTVVASDLNYLSGKRIGTSRKFISEENIDGLRVLRAYTYPALHRSFVWRVISFLSFMVTSFCAGVSAGKTDIAMGTSPPIFQALSAWLISRFRRVPFLLEIRDLWPAFAIDMGVLKNPLLIAMSYWLEKFLYKHATHILVNSPAYRDYIISKGVVPSKVSLIANGVDIETFPQCHDRDKIRKKLALNGKFVVTYTGALGLANDIPVILGAAEILRNEENIYFLFAGDGKERANLEMVSKHLPNVRFAGSLPKEDIPGILAASDICVASLQNIPMFKMTYPNKIFDYMASGKPTVLAIDGIIREVVEKAGAGIFVRPGDAQGIADAVSYLYANPKVVESMGKSARKCAAENFDRKMQAMEFHTLVEEMAKKESFTADGEACS